MKSLRQHTQHFVTKRRLNHTQSRSIGIKALDFYFPNQYIDQTDLARYDGIPEGKYLFGLGQREMAFVHSDREDTASISMTALDRLMKNNDICEHEIGGLFVGTETPIDKSKSIKSVLMDRFDNKEMEGVDQTNACYSATAALFNAIYWYQATQAHLPLKERKMAIVVGADIAGYREQNARPTAGSGAVAMLIGDNALFDIDYLHKSTYIDHSYDFYKPNPQSSYPVVDGKYSNECYLRALDNTYGELARKHQLDLGGIDYTCFHAPYNKLVQKSFGRLVYLDMKNNNGKLPDYLGQIDMDLEQYADMSAEQSYNDPALIKDFTTVSKQLYQDKCVPSVELPQRIGNTYSASLYAGLTSLLANQGQNMADKNIMMFSYGSGLAASAYLMKVKNDPEALAQQQQNIDMHTRLDERVQYKVEDFVEVLRENEDRYLQNVWESQSSTENLAQGTFFLSEGQDNMWRRKYVQKEAVAQ